MHLPGSWLFAKVHVVGVLAHRDNRCGLYELLVSNYIEPRTKWANFDTEARLSGRLVIERLLVRYSPETLRCVFEQDTLSSA